MADKTVIHFRAVNKDKTKAIFVRVSENEMPRIADIFFDNNYELHQVAEWYYWQQLQETNPNREHGALVLEIEDGEDIGIFDE